jgi:signal peptidase II
MKSVIEKYRMLGLAVVIVVLADQLTKAWVQSGMRLHQSIPVIDNFFSLTYIRNPGAAFGLFSDGGGTVRTVFFILVSVAAIGFLGTLYAKTPSERPLLRLAFSLVTGGAAGNLIDRVRFGEVVDFLDFYVGRYHWPAFNVADSCITVGVAFLVLYSVVGGKVDSDLPARP